jgi:hypothetical protein
VQCCRSDYAKREGEESGSAGHVSCRAITVPIVSPERGQWLRAESTSDSSPMTGSTRDVRSLSV